MIGLPLGFLYANAVEWVVHKYVLHGLGKKKGSWWAFHWHEHHKTARRLGMSDPGYDAPIWDWSSRGKEAVGIFALMAVHVPLWSVAPVFTTGVWLSALNYLRRHKQAHADVEWGKQHMPWHYDHHMGRNQDANWCVSYPWIDWLMGTREPWLGTEQQIESDARRAAQAEASALREAQPKVLEGSEQHGPHDDVVQLEGPPAPEEKSGTRWVMGPTFEREASDTAA